MERRTKEGYRLRIYIDQLKIVKAMTIDEWITQWAKTAKPDSTYISHAEWIHYLETCAMQEADRLAPPMLEAA